MDPLSPETIRKMQQRKWDSESGKPLPETAATTWIPQKSRKPLPYFNIIRKDIICLSNILTEAGLNPIRWYRHIRMRQSEEFRDFMEQHFKKPGE
jgi:hypothetical protein